MIDPEEIYADGYKAGYDNAIGKIINCEICKHNGDVENCPLLASGLTVPKYSDYCSMGVNKYETQNNK